MDNLQQWLHSLQQKNTPDFETCLPMLGRFFPLLYEFENTEQDAQWHAEGNVAIHTDRVLKALYQLLENEVAHLAGEQRQILILAALLHDIAKPLTTKRKEISGIERIVATKHEEVGASYLATKLPQLPLSQYCIDTVMALVHFHQMPKQLVIRDKAFSDYFQLALNVDLELIYWLEVADIKGRICMDLAQQLDILAQFRMFAEDYELWGVVSIQHHWLSTIQVKQNKAEQIYLDGYAIRQLACGDIHSIEAAIAKHFEPCQDYAHLYVMCGVSGSGKSSWIKKHLANFDIISLDEIRKEINGKRECQKNRGQVLQIAKQRLKQSLGKKRDVVWDATNIRKDFRDVICQLGLQYGALITIVAFQLTEASLKVNNKNRPFAIPETVISEQIGKLQWPSVIEGHRMLIIGDKGVELSRIGSF